MDKLKTFIKAKIKPILFCIIFATVCILYNQDDQDLNYFLKRGTILEYSLDKNTIIDKEKIEEKLASEGVRFSFVENLKANSNIYDTDNASINQILHVILSVAPKETNAQLFDNISNFIFDNYKSSKLLNIKTYNNNYHKPFNSFLMFLGLTAVSFFIWTILLYLFSNDKYFFKNAIQKLKNSILLQFKRLSDFINKTKENGFIWSIKKILFEDTTDKDGNDKEPDMAKEIASTIIFVLISVIVIRYFIGELRWIPSGSMRPTILERDRVFVEKLDFPKKEIKRGDILVFYPPGTKLKSDPWSIFTRLSGIFCKDTAFIKRAIGMPNDKFEIKYDNKNKEYRVYINDIGLNEPYILSKQNWTPCNKEMLCGPFVIPEGHYFMMGDNRGNSQDSRFWGFLPQERIIGRANFMFWPISRINKMNDKYVELNKEKKDETYKKQQYIINRYEFLL